VKLIVIVRVVLMAKTAKTQSVQMGVFRHARTVAFALTNAIVPLVMLAKGVKDRQRRVPPAIME